MSASFSLASKGDLPSFVLESCSIRVEAGESYVVSKGTEVDDSVSSTDAYLADGLLRRLTFTKSGLVTFCIRSSNHKSNQTNSISGNGSITPTVPVSALPPHADSSPTEGVDSAMIRATFVDEDEQRSQDVMFYFKQNDGDVQPWAVELSRIPNVDYRWTADYVWTVSFRHYGSEHSEVRPPSVKRWTGGKTLSADNLIYSGNRLPEAKREKHFKEEMRPKINDLVYLQRKIQQYGPPSFEWTAVVNNLVDHLRLSFNEPK